MSQSNDQYMRHSEFILDSLVAAMNNLSNRLQSAKEEYKNKISSSANQGFMTDYTEILGGVKFQNLSSHIDSMEDVISKLRQEINSQKQHIQDLRRNVERDAH